MTATPTQLRRSERLRLKRAKATSSPVQSHQKHQVKVVSPLRRSERLTNKLKKDGLDGHIAFGLRRSQRLAEKPLKKTQQSQLRPMSPLAKKGFVRCKTTSPLKTADSKKSVRKTTAFRPTALFASNPVSRPVSATEPEVQIPPVLLQMERDCSDVGWLWLRWNGVPLENRIPWKHILARRGKFLQLACASRDASLVKAVYEISKSPAYRGNEKWRLDDALHYVVEYQLYELLPWVDTWTLDTIDQEQRPNCTQQPQPPSMLMNMALVNGDLHIAKWLVEHRPKVRGEVILKSTQQALGRHSLELLQWATSHYSTAFSSTWAFDQVHPMGFLGQLCGERPLCCAADEAVACGNLPVVQYLHEKHQEEKRFSMQSLSAAAANGHLEVLQFLHDQQPGEWTTDVLDQAAAHGHLDIVKFLHVNRAEGCTEAAMDGAARNGHFEMLKFLHCERNEGFSASAMIDAAANGHFTIVEFLNAQLEREYSSTLCRAMNQAAKNNNLDVLVHLHEKFSQVASKDTLILDSLMQQAALWKCDAVVQFLVTKTQFL